MSELIKAKHQLGALSGVQKTDTYYEIHYTSGDIARLTILADGIFRFQVGNFEQNPLELNLDLFASNYMAKSSAKATSEAFIVQSGPYRLVFGQKPALLTIFDETVHRARLSEVSPIELGENRASQFLKQNANEFYYGTGLQGGRYSHKGRQVLIKDLGVSGEGGTINPLPFFWSNAGFGILRNTLADGLYNFNAENGKASILTHQENTIDNFYIIGNSPQAILERYYALVGKPQILPDFALNMGYLGNFIDQKWLSADKSKRDALRFENGSYYQKDLTNSDLAVSASLNGEDNIEFSARAMIDRYQRLNFPLGWIIPDFGAKTSVSAESLNNFTSYANDHGVASGVSQVQNITEDTKVAFINKDQAKKSFDALKEHVACPLVLTNDGDARSSRYAGLIYGETGGEWDSIKVQIASLLGISLSGQPIVGAACDGLYGGANAQVNVRDYQWKAFTPLFFSMDGQGNLPKLPFFFNNKITRINRAYAALRQQLSTYLKALFKEARDGDLIMRPLFMEFPHEKVNYRDDFAHEFMLGKDLLIAPITDGREDENGYSIKDRLYLPDHRCMWIDLFTGEKYAGGRVYNNLKYPIWHLPVFVKAGAILDFGKRHFSIYPYANSSTLALSDLGQTKLESNLSDGVLTVTVNPSEGNYQENDKQQTTSLDILTDRYPGKVVLKINDEPIRFNEYGSNETFQAAKEGYYFSSNYIATKDFSGFTDKRQNVLHVKLSARDITDTKIELIIDNFSYGGLAMAHAITDSALRPPRQPMIDSKKTSAHSITAVWPNKAQVQIEVNGIVFDGIYSKSFTFNSLVPNTLYKMRLRYISGNKVSEWSDYFGAKTKPSQFTYAVKNIKLETMLGGQTENATDLIPASEWISDKEIENNSELNFIFPEKEALSRMVYVPRSADQVGRILNGKVLISENGTDFTDYQDFTWHNDPKNKVIGLRDVQAKAIKLIINETSDNLVSAKQFYFFKAK